MITQSSNIWLLTGRSGDFCDARLNAITQTFATEDAADLDAIREALGLLDRSNDVAVLSVLGAVYNKSTFINDLMVGAAARDRFVTIYSKYAPTAKVTYATVRSINGITPPQIVNTARRLPLINNIRVSVTNSDSVALTIDGSTKTVDALRNYAGDLVVPALVDLGVRCAFTVADSASFTITFPPLSYPFAHAVERVGTLAYDLMVKHGLMSLFSTTSSSVDKVAAIACAVMREQARRVAYVGDIEQVNFTAPPAADLPNYTITLDGKPLTYNEAYITLSK